MPKNACSAARNGAVSGPGKAENPTPPDLARASEASIARSRLNAVPKAPNLTSIDIPECVPSTFQTVITWKEGSLADRR